jgi:hypothetical protein
VLPCCRDKTANLRTELNRIIERAGIKTWPKPFQNFRSTRETELAETFPLKVVCEWIGNSEAPSPKNITCKSRRNISRAR